MQGTRTRECRLAGNRLPFPVIRGSFRGPRSRGRQAGFPRVVPRIFPLALSCERVLGTPGRLTAADGTLELRQAGAGAIYAPLVVDWNRGRRASAASWRPLTVAQNGEAVAPRVAAGCRLKVGSAQWLIYRSLAPVREPRTVLGQHTMYETLVGRFLQSGKVEPIVQVEQRTETAP